MAFYHHSRPLLGGTPDIGLPGGKRKGQSTTLITALSALISMVYVNALGGGAGRPAFPVLFWSKESASVGPMRQYLDLMRHVRDHGGQKMDRTGTGTKSVFGYQMRFDLGGWLSAGDHQAAASALHHL